jgi:DNA replication protein DnaC
MPPQEQHGILHFMAQLAEAEIQSRLHKRTEMYLKLSKLRNDAVLEQVHCTSDRNLSRESVSVISACGFVKRAENILITRAAGCGKSYLA